MWGKRKSAQDDQASVVGAATQPGNGAISNEESPGANPPSRSAATPKPNGAEPGVANGVGGEDANASPKKAPPGPTADEVRFAVTFTRIVSILSRSPHYKHYTLGDLEWLAVPPILTGQCAVMEAKVNGRQMPVAVALWASVSKEVDKRLSEILTTPIKLRPDEWRSGDILWLVDAVGDSKAIPLLLRQLQQTVLKGQEVKMRTRAADSGHAVRALGAAMGVKEDEKIG